MIKKYLFLPMLLLIVVASGCSNQISQEDITTTPNEEITIVQENAEQIQTDLEDPSLEELDNVDLSNW